MVNEIKKAITSRIALINKVLDDYRDADTELNGYCFDFEVRMPQSDILNAYAEIQHIINGDQVMRVNAKGEEVEPLIPYNQYTDIYKGNCMEFLESFNGRRDFIRVSNNADEVLSFIF